MNQGALMINREFLSSEEVKSMLGAIDDTDFVFTHPDGMYENNAWRVIKLISGGKRMPVLEKYPQLKKVLDYFQCPVMEMVFYSILPGGNLHPHRDMTGTLELGRLRFHVPLVTNPQVEFRVSKKVVPMKPGELWALNTSYLHSVANLGSTDRIHLVLEVEANDWCWSILPKKKITYYTHAAGFFTLVGCTAVKSVMTDRQKLKGRISQGKWMLSRLKRKMLGSKEPTSTKVE